MPDSLLHERSAFKALVATVAESERSIIRLSWKKTLEKSKLKLW